MIGNKIGTYMSYCEHIAKESPSLYHDVCSEPWPRGAQKASKEHIIWGKWCSLTGLTVACGQTAGIEARMISKARLIYNTEEFGFSSAKILADE